MSAYMIDATTGPIPVVSDELIITDRAWSHLLPWLEAKGWTPPESDPAP